MGGWGTKQKVERMGWEVGDTGLAVVCTIWEVERIGLGVEVQYRIYIIGRYQRLSYKMLDEL